MKEAEDERFYGNNSQRSTPRYLGPAVPGGDGDECSMKNVPPANQTQHKTSISFSERNPSISVLFQNCFFHGSHLSKLCPGLEQVTWYDTASMMQNRIKREYFLCSTVCYSFLYRMIWSTIEEKERKKKTIQTVTWQGQLGGNLL